MEAHVAEAQVVAEREPPGLAARTLCEAFQITAASRPEQAALRSVDGGVEISYGELRDRVARLAAGLAGLGYGRGDCVGLMMVNRMEFNVVDLAAMHLGATPFSVYNTSAPDQIAYLFADAGNRIVVTERQFVARILAVRDAGAPLDHIVVVDDDAPGEGLLTLAGVEAAAPERFDVEAAWRAVEPEDVLTLIYTSGTTGPPKGVMTTHANMMAELRGVHAAVPSACHGRMVSFLPSAHIADRWGLHYSALMTYGHTVTPCPDPREVMVHVKQVRPTVFGAVPRVWEKVKAGLEAALPPHALADPGPELQAQVRTMLGLDACDLFFTGAAPTPDEVLAFFLALGIPICEVWGMSETSCVATTNRPDAIRIGSVGRPIAGVQIRLADDGELLVKGDIVMAGYRNKPDLTAEAIDAGGWLHTGDVAEIDDDGSVRIVDRKKELIINAAGKNMSPANIEARLKSASPVIGQAVCLGDRRPYNVALIVLDPDGAAGRSASDPQVLEAVREGVEHANMQLSRVEQIKRYAIVDGDWLPGGDELTPTMKLKRKPIAEKYATEIERLYAG